MKLYIRNILCGLFITAFAVTDVWAANSSSRVATNSETARTGNTINRAKATVNPRAGATRATRNVTVRTAVTPVSANRNNVSALTRAHDIISDAGNAIINRAWGVNRSAKPISARIAKSVGNPARSAAIQSGASRARATAVFSDVSKLGDGYNQCREAYNTCMDQFCAGANDTYRRCYCSNTYRTLRDREDALDAATAMLSQFENNNLNAVDKTAEEVNAMYSATAGELAIKQDISASMALLNDIGDLLSGKKKPENTQNQTSLSALDFSADLGDIWGSASNDSIFSGGNSAKDLSAMDGVELYNNAHNQCMQLIGNTCEAGAVKNMTKSAYSILITQDCNAYQKKLDAKTEQVKSTVRTAEKYLREARLEEYRSHNSADVNECLDKVESAILAPTACGTDFAKCLDYTGVYINSSSGEPIYSPRLFKLNELIVLDGTSADVLAQNIEFNNFLDSKRVYAKTALDTCRDISETVWSEFKRNALIKISQAQDEKIEEVKMSCVSTMKECYDTQSGALKSFDDTTAQASGALAARASRDMCSDKVLACAALYSRDGTDVCKVDARGKITNASTCGLTSLVNFVNTVDDVRIAEGCGTAVENYLKQLCTPSAGDEGYPWNCRLRAFGTMPSAGAVWSKKNNSNNMTLVDLVTNYAIENCVGTDATSLNETKIQNDVVLQLENLREQLSDKLAQKCLEIDGVWFFTGQNQPAASTTNLKAFYSNVFGGRDGTTETSLGICYENTTMTQCIGYNTNSEKDGDMARYDAARDECVFTDAWYAMKCESLGGIWENSICYYITD